MRRTVLASTVTLALASPFVQALDKPADGFPQRPISVIVPYGPGGGSDQLTRAWAAAMEPIIGVGLQVINKPGGGGMAAVPDFMTAPKDGYTILQSIDDAITNYASGRLREHPGDDWTPICVTQITFSQIYVQLDDERFSDFESFVEYARANPGQLTVANVGNLGSMERVSMGLLEQALGFETRQIAFDNPSERYAALVGGQVDALFEQPGDVRNFLEADQFKPIFTFLEQSPEAFAGVPAIGDIEQADFAPLLRFRGFWLHRDVSDERKQYLEAACRQAFDSDSYQAFNTDNYMHLIDSYRDTEGARELIDTSIETYTAVYKDIGLIE